MDHDAINTNSECQQRSVQNLLIELKYLKQIIKEKEAIIFNQKVIIKDKEEIINLQKQQLSSLPKNIPREFIAPSNGTINNISNLSKKSPKAGAEIKINKHGVSTSTVSQSRTPAKQQILLRTSQEAVDENTLPQDKDKHPVRQSTLQQQQDDWKIQRNRHPRGNKPKQKSGVIGSLKTSTTLTVAVNDMNNYVKSYFPEAVCEAVNSKHPETYSSFKVTIDFNNLDGAMIADILPYGAFVNRFFQKRTTRETSRD